MEGYHNIETIFYPVKIFDALEALPASKLGFDSSGIDIPGREEDNLCIKGYHLLSKDYKLPPLNIHLHKNIPIGAGLGGGSADAGFFIRLLNEQFDLKLTTDQMMDYARVLGAGIVLSSSKTNRFLLLKSKATSFETIRLDLSFQSTILY